MHDIILYILIISVGYFITKKGWIPKIIANFHILGLESIIVAACAVLGSILLTHIFYRGGDK